jgi:UPF0271 protein
MPVHSGLKILSMKIIDINCDMGEGIGNDALIMPYISSANIACGYHAGDEVTMKQTIDLCLKHHVAIGVHPSFPDKENFGRTDMLLPLKEVYELIIKQIQLFEKIAAASGTSIMHIKLHGALYNMAARDTQLAPVIALAVKDYNKKLILYGLSGSHLIKEGKNIGLKTASEVFADRTYQDNGSLTPRHKPEALIEDVDKAVAQVLQMVNEGTVTSLSGKKIPIVAETVCIHGDGAHAVEFAKAIHHALKENNIEIKAIS